MEHLTIHFPKPLDFLSCVHLEMSSEDVFGGSWHSLIGDSLSSHGWWIVLIAAIANDVAVLLLAAIR